MKKWLFMLTLVAAAAGCKSNPYCLNCKDSGNGVITPEDLMPPPNIDMAGQQQTGPDLANPNGPCTPTNGGVEKCDGIDNDCNGKIDDVDPSKLIGDPQNCGMCGNECKFPNAYGQCVGGFDGGMPMCKMGACQPGYVDLDGNPNNGCEYACIPSMPTTEICDGADNNCDGQVDEGFTATWFDAQHQKPKYDSRIDDCGQCGTVCNLGPGTIMACQGTGTNGAGQCNVVACFNGNDASGTHQTYRHNPATGNLNQTGCEYHCPKPATQTGIDCDPNGACTFPPETCNGIDDDCNFLIDDNLTGFGGACPDGTTGKYCTGSQCGVGICKAGTLACTNGGVVCNGSVGPSAEVCNGVDDNCDGQVDELFTANGDPGYIDATTHQMPRYNSDTNNCGGCGGAFKCALANATSACTVKSGEQLGSCAVSFCNAGFTYIDMKSPPGACNNPAPGPENSCNNCGTGGTKVTGVGCWYGCTPTGGETCNGKDDDCNGCVDDGLTAPNICSNLGTCANNHTVKCQVVSAGPPAQYGWKCNYGPGVDVDSNGNLLTSELECDDRDNNCNGACDETWPQVPVDTTLNACTNPHTAAACSGGQGACLLSGTYACNAAHTDKVCQTAGGTPITSNGDLTKATDELCNGKDDDCNGQIDESTDYTVGGLTFHGWHDPMAVVGSVYVYAFEAARPDATGTSAGSKSTRACANAGVLPWANVTEAQAQAACASIKNSAGNPMRLCTATEWTAACDGNVAASTHWSMSNSTTAYVNAVCNDATETDQRCNPSLITSCPKYCGQTNQCYCAADADCPGGASGSCDTTKHVCTTTLCGPAQCAKTCNATGQCTCSSNSDCNPGFTCSGGGVCTGSGAWPTGSIGTGSAGSSNDQCYVAYGSVKAHDFTGNVQEWTSTQVTLKSGTSWSLAASATPGQWTLSGLTGMLSSDVGDVITLTGSTNTLDNGSWTIVSYVGSTSVVISIPNGAMATGSSTTPPAWSINYYKLRGGNYSTTSSTGDTCEFDFDIQRPTFVNTNVGFRCCSDAAP